MKLALKKLYSSINMPKRHKIWEASMYRLKRNDINIELNIIIINIWNESFCLEKLSYIFERISCALHTVQTIPPKPRKKISCWAVDMKISSIFCTSCECEYHLHWHNFSLSVLNLSVTWAPNSQKAKIIANDQNTRMKNVICKLGSTLSWEEKKH